jgi:hypothetical protein
LHQALFNALTPTKIFDLPRCNEKGSFHKIFDFLGNDAGTKKSLRQDRLLHPLIFLSVSGKNWRVLPPT